MLSGRKTLTTLLVAASFMGAWLAASGAPPVSLADGPSLPQNDLCFIVDGKNANTGALLQTQNFGNSFVGIGKLLLMCEQANKYLPTDANQVPPSAASATKAACYAVNEGNNRRSD